MRGSVFNRCKNLKRVELNEGLTVLGSRDDGGQYGFIAVHNGVFQNSGLEEIVLPGSLEEIGCTVFNHCANLRVIWLRDDCTASIPEGIRD